MQVTIPCVCCFRLTTPSLVAIRKRERESIVICETNGINISYNKHLLQHSVLVITGK